MNYHTPVYEPKPVYFVPPQPAPVYVHSAPQPVYVMQQPQPVYVQSPQVQPVMVVHETRHVPSDDDAETAACCVGLTALFAGLFLMSNSSKDRRHQ